jgi:hypothetical protein
MRWHDARGDPARAPGAAPLRHREGRGWRVGAPLVLEGNRLVTNVNFSRKL